MFRWLVLLAAVGISAAPASAQVAITGRVVAAGSGEAIPNARVLLNSASEEHRIAVLTDGEGRFTVPAPPGKHPIVVTKTRYARGLAAAAPGPEPVEIQLERGAAISGRIINEIGEPVVGARVTVASQGGEASVTGTAEADDRGEYRVGALPAATFAVSVAAPDTAGTPATMRVAVVTSASGARTMTGTSRLERTFYPNATDLKGAQPLQLRAGDEISGIDFVLAFGSAGMPLFDVARLASEPFRPVRPAPRNAPPSGVISGRVVNPSGSALPFATVRLDEASRPTPRIIRTGLDGRFEFRTLPGGGHRLRASKPGYFHGDVSIALGEAETREDVQIRVEPWGAVSGRVLDERGEPVQGARIELLQVRYEAGRRRLVPAGIAPRMTDDLGSYRLYAVPAGQYIVSAEAGPAAAANLPGYVRSFFPGTATIGDAQFITPERGDIDIALARGRAVRVRGRYVNTDGLATGGSLLLTPSRHSLAALGTSIGARIFSDGRFEFVDVPPGEYVIQGSRGRRNPWTEGEFGATRVPVVDADIEDVVVRTSVGSSVQGRVVFETHLGSKEPNPGDIEITPVPVDPDLSPADNHRATASIGRDWSFVLDGINGPRRIETTRLPAGWMLKEIRAGGFEVTDSAMPFGAVNESLRDVEVVLTDRINEIFGQAQDDRARPAVNASVIMVGADRSTWYPRSRFMRRTTTDGDGWFSVAGIPPGRYYAAVLSALPSEGDDAWQEPAFLDTVIPFAETVSVGEGQKVSVSPRLIDRR